MNTLVNIRVQSRKIKIVSRLTWREYYGQFSPNNFFEFKEKERRFDYLERLTGDGDVFFKKNNYVMLLIYNYMTGGRQRI